jgi:hypothetical protein
MFRADFATITRVPYKNPNKKNIGQLLYFTSILVKHPDNGSKITET